MKQVLVDGFSFNANLRFLSYRYFPLALGQLEGLRRSENHRPRWYPVPEDVTVPIAALDTRVYQLRVVPNSVFWGYQFNAIGSAPANFFVQIGDPRPFFSAAVIGTALRPSGNQRLFPVIVEPYMICPPGHLEVEITNNDAAAARSCQLLLLFAEPCELCQLETV
jgi:hypothetical protein